MKEDKRKALVHALRDGRGAKRREIEPKIAPQAAIKERLEALIGPDEGRRRTLLSSGAVEDAVRRLQLIPRFSSKSGLDAELSSMRKVLEAAETAVDALTHLRAEHSSAFFGIGALRRLRTEYTLNFKALVALHGAPSSALESLDILVEEVRENIEELERLRVQHFSSGRGRSTNAPAHLAAEILVR